MSDEKTQKGFYCVSYMPPGTSIVSMVEFRDHLFVATNDGVFMMREGKFQPVQFVWPGEDVE